MCNIYKCIFVHETQRILKNILNNTCELVQLLNAWAIPKSAIPLQILKISKQMLILLKKLWYFFTLKPVVSEIRKSNAAIKGQSDVFFCIWLGNFGKRINGLIWSKMNESWNFSLIDSKSENFITCINLFFCSLAYLTLNIYKFVLANSYTQSKKQTDGF